MKSKEALRKIRYRRTDGGMAAKPDQLCLLVVEGIAEVPRECLIRIFPDAIVVTDKNGKITLLNPVAERLMGYKAEEVMGKPAAELYSKKEVARKLMQEMYKGKGEVVNYETAIRTRSGEVVPVLISASQLRDGKGEVIGAVKFVKDITERKKAEEELERQRNFFKMLLDNMGEGVVFVNPEGKREFVNKKYCEITGYSQEEIIGSPYLDFVHPDDVEHVKREADKRKEGYPSTIEYRRIRKDGTVIYTKTTGVPLFDGNGRYLGVIAILSDMTERKRIEQEIIRHNQELSAINEIGWAMSQSFSLKEVMDIALEKVIEITGMDDGLIRLLDEEKGELVAIAHKGVPPEVMEKIERFKLNEGVAGAVVLSKEPLLLEDITKDPRSHETAIEGGIKSVAAIPLLAKVKVVGTLHVGSHSFHPFHPRDKEFLATIGNQIGIFIENAKLYAESEKNLEEGLALYRMSQALNSTRTSQEVYRIAMELVKSLFHATATAIFLYDEKGDLLKLIASVPSFGGDVEISPNQGIAGEVFVTGRVLFIPDIVKDSRAIFRKGLEEGGFRSVIALPIRLRDKIIGVLQIFGEPEVKEPTQRQIELLETFSTQIGIAIERANYEEQLRFLAGIPVYSPYGLVTIDNNRIITSWNKGAEDLFGWKGEEVIGRSALIIAPDDDMAENQKRNFEKIIKEGILRAVEMERVRKDGNRFPVELTSWTIKDEEGKIIGYTGFFRDLTEIKKMQQELDKRQMELFQAEKLASIGELAAGACHEIRNPLNIISGYAQVLLPKYKLNPTLSRALKIIDEQCQRIEKITRGLTLFSRKGEMKKEIMDLKEVIMTTLSLVEEGMRLDNIKIIIRVEGPVILEADRDRLSQVILSLINNARDALHGKAGTIKISTDIVERDGRKEALLSIADTGEGIKKEHLEQIFVPFFTTKPLGKGTGLGLSVAYGIIADHGGSIKVESRVGKGTIFKVFLPLDVSSP